MYYCCGLTEKGVMPHNEDAMLVGRMVIDKGKTEQKLNGPFIAAVSDGVSGEAAGEVASRMCLERVRDIEDYQKAKLKAGLLEIHKQLAEYGKKHKDSNNMQTTLCGIAVSENDEIVAFNVGDSRLYRYRGGRLRQISRDQSLVQLLYEEGSITQEERRTHVHRNIIFPAFGNVKTDPRGHGVRRRAASVQRRIIGLCFIYRHPGDTGNAEKSSQAAVTAGEESTGAGRTG